MSSSVAAGAVLHGRYRLDEILGGGGMGVVWLATDFSTGQQVAIKAPKEGQTTHGVFTEKLIFESDVLGMLSHDHIVRRVDFFYDRGIPYLVLEYVQAETLDATCSRTPLDETQAVGKITQVLLAADYIHSLNLLHRDIRPKNVMSSSPTYLKVIDFGTAVYFNRRVDDIVVAPGGYTPPEQYRHGASPQGDIWSVGGTLFHMLTGKHPITLLKGYPDNPLPVMGQELPSNISESVANVITRAMAPDPAQRFTTAREMISALQGVSERIEGPVLEIMNLRIKLDVPQVLVGRANPTCDPPPSPDLLSRGVIQVREGGKLFLKIVDPYCWISSYHLELVESGGRWYIRDLGSLNSTAVESGGAVASIWKGSKVPGNPYPISDRDRVFLAYNSHSGPYLVAVFRTT